MVDVRDRGLDPDDLRVIDSPAMARASTPVPAPTSKYRPGDPGPAKRTNNGARRALQRPVQRS